MKTFALPCKAALPLLAALLLVPVPAHAEERDAPAVPEWSFGVGAGLTSLLAGQTVASRGHIERRIGERTALSLNLSGGYENQQYDAVGFDLGSASGSLGVGLRWLWAEVGPVRLSFTTGVSFGYEWSEDREQQAPDYETWVKTYHRTYGPSVGGGVAFDLPLLEGLSLRMASTVVRAGYTVSEGDEPYYAAPNGERWGAGFSFDPSLQLRIEL